jgi:hypothetical protein
MKQVLFTIAICFAGITVFAQSRPFGSELSMSMEGALPLDMPHDGLKTNTNIGFGLTLKYAYNLKKTIAFTFESGYFHFPGKSITVEVPNPSASPVAQPPIIIPESISFTLIPLKVGFRYSQKRFYAEPQAGVGFWYEINSHDGVSTLTGITYAAEIGYLVTQNFEAGIRYEGIGANMNGINLGFFGLRLAYIFPFINNFDLSYHYLK